VRRLARIALATLIYCVIACSTTQPASGQTYSVFNCHFPDGHVAPVDAWRVIGPAGGAAYDLSCTDGTGIGVSLSHTQTYPRGYETGIGLRVPPDIAIRAATVRDQQWASAGTGWATGSGYWAAWPGSPWQAVNFGCFGACHFAVATWRLVMDGHDYEMFGLGVTCSDSSQDPNPCPSTATAGAIAWGVELTAADARPPEFSSPVGGSLLDHRSAAAIRQLRYAVRDRGGGVRAATLEIDGKRTQTATFSSATAPCIAPYGQLVPCPATASGVFTVDTSRLEPGHHSGRLLVSDVANPPLTYSFDFFAPGPPTSAAACSVDHSVTARLAQNPVAYGSRRLRFSVRGIPSPPRTVIVMEERAARFTVISSATRRRQGYVGNTATYRSKTIRIAVPVAGGSQYACSQPLRLSVRAGLRLRVRPRAVSNSETIHFSGRLRGGRLAGGRLVEIQARALGGLKRWTLVQSLRTTARGKFRMRYTFRRTHERVRFQFRAVRRKANDFPYAFGASNRQVVLVRG
jgi:hypothetical protein